jgi:hypothetical protein
LQVKIKDDRKRFMSKPIEQIPLPNGLTAEVHDLSRSIAADTVRVELAVIIRLELRPDDFAEPSHFECMRSVFGNEMLYERRLLQSFVNNDQKEAVFSMLLENFRQASFRYLGSPDFRSRFVTSKYRDFKQNPYKYRILQDDRTEPA